LKLTGADIVVRCLIDMGVKTVFGYPGGAILNVYDSLYKHSKELQHILVRHEQGALHAADGYARVTGDVGVAIVTSGPGATNAVTGLATAYMDSIPILCITGQVPSQLIGNDAFQEADIVGITRSCTKHNYLVKDIDQLARILREAKFIAESGRPGPVLVDIPKDITSARTEYVHDARPVEVRSYRPTMDGHIGQIRRAMGMFKQARRPLFYTGGGVILANAASELTRFARMIGAPVTNTLMGLGGFPASDPQFVGMLGMHGTYEANMAVSKCDLLVAIGARFDDRVTGKISEFAPHATIVHIDVDPTSISKNVLVDVPIVGDTRQVLRRMIDLADDPEFQKGLPSYEEWWNEIRTWRKQDCLRYPTQEGVIEAQFVIQKLYELTEGKAIIVTDVGQHQMWAAQFYGFDEPRRWLTSGGLGTMGYGLPAAIGAQMAMPDAQVVVISGDGSIQMNIQELATAHAYHLPVKVIVLNNGFLGMVRQWQEFFYDRRYAETVMTATPDFRLIAEAYGAMGLQASRPEEVEPLLRQMLASDRTTIAEFHVNREANVYPMVPAGAALNEMILL
jgi:acetolactate synthase-1/2/3 large subunit